MPKVAQRRGGGGGGSGGTLPQKIFKFTVGFQKCHFQHFLQDIFSKFIGRKMQNLFFFSLIRAGNLGRPNVWDG